MCERGWREEADIAARTRAFTARFSSFSYHRPSLSRLVVASPLSHLRNSRVSELQARKLPFVSRRAFLAAGQVSARGRTENARGRYAR